MDDAMILFQLKWFDFKRKNVYTSFKILMQHWNLKKCKDRCIILLLKSCLEMWTFQIKVLSLYCVGVYEKDFFQKKKKILLYFIWYGIGMQGYVLYGL